MAERSNSLKFNLELQNRETGNLEMGRVYIDAMEKTVI